MNGEVMLSADRFPLVREIGWHRVDALYTHPDRVVEYHVFLFVVRGRMQVIEDGITYWVSGNEHLFLKSGLHHWGEPVTEPGTEWYWIHFNLPIGERLHYREHAPLLKLDYLQPDHYQYLIPMPKHGSSPFHTGLEARLKTLAADCRSPGEHIMTHVSLRVCELFLELQKAMNQKDQGGQYSKTDTIAGRVISYLMLHTEEDFDSVKLAEHMKLNYSYLSAAFKKQTGQTIVEAHTRLRMGKAIEMMRNGTLNVSEISYGLGYRNPYYFSRVFKNVLGESPSLYMRHFYKM
ncbi:helix-turn-helix domain-containing protein [Paenibacillus humicola]|uniref:helix-turn-helix domain-containing protein n=1 Tax=Paenibacillus humicola TaxID=3110540 RepID=UPI00237C0FA4|nr:AraC family transcriptional regulator [Paenibacillus humicola]